MSKLARWLATYEALVSQGDTANAARHAGRCRAKCLREGLAVPPWAALKPEPSKLLRPSQQSPAAPVQLPAELVAWRKAEAGRVVSFGATSVKLHTWIDGAPYHASFAHADAAIAAIAAGSVEWRRTPTAEPSGFARRAG